MARFEAVLFDWMLTLAHYPTPADHVRQALESLGRGAEPVVVGELVAAMSRAEELPEVRQALSIEDTSAEAHVFATHQLYDRAGFDRELADAMYGLLGQPSFHPPYPDAAPTVASLHAAGVRIAVVSDIHVDLRGHADMFGFGSHIDAWALSYELGIQKPDRRIFEEALGQLGCDPEQALMVGDGVFRDGPAADIGITSLILPAPDRGVSAPEARGLDRVSRLVGVAS